ncbi:MAG: lysoplasmalogenase [Bacilli bacterium]|jgi:uncharacterized membrane protein YhhN|nr:lysoplasmalogenase [Bacilli bacterium]MCH4277810.1 lysoplasmalogenase [Bacilli bacterium]MCI2054980.1 lysoplasmalogenase [Bacilli bacterium]
MKVNEIVGLCFFALFIVVSILQLSFSFMENDKMRRITKPGCLFFLFLSVVVAFPSYPLIYVGLLFGLFGDTFLLSKNNKTFLSLGIVSFFINHVLFIAQALTLIYSSGALDAYPMAWLYFLIYSLALPLILIYPIYMFTRKSKFFTAFGIFYAAVLFTELTVSILGTCLGLSHWLSLGIIGGALFIASDAILTRTIFIKDIKRRDFYIMLTYLAAQALIVSGFVFTIVG